MDDIVVVLVIIIVQVLFIVARVVLFLVHRRMICVFQVLGGSKCVIADVCLWPFLRIR